MIELQLGEGGREADLPLEWHLEVKPSDFAEVPPQEGKGILGVALCCVDKLRLARRGRARLEGLSATGRTQTECAAELGVSVRTVDRAQARGKL